MLELQQVSKTFPGGVRAMEGVSLEVKPGEFVVIVGESGAGKSTLLRTINGLVRPDSGRVLVGGRNVAAMKGAELRRVRRGIGLIFQDFNLVERSMVLTNVLTGRLGYHPTWKTMLGMFPQEDVALARGALERISLADKTYSKAGDLSGGQKQRVSIARVLVQQPHLILADEPVASLDPPTAHDIMEWFRRINRQEGITVIVNLHDIHLASQYGDRLVGMRSGRIVHDGPVASVNEDTFTRIYGRKPAREQEVATRAAL
jgi:phosphonate transport system ATP-binding protein